MQYRVGAHYYYHLQVADEVSVPLEAVAATATALRRRLENRGRLLQGGSVTVTFTISMQSEAAADAAVRTHARTHARMHARMHARAHASTHARTHPHARTPLLPPPPNPKPHQLQINHN